MQRLLLRASSFVLFALVSLACAIAGSLSGNVTSQAPDAPGGALQGVVVTLKQHDHIVTTTTTDQYGNYLFPGLADGSYSLLFETPGYLQGELRNYRLEVNADVIVNAQLTPILTGAEIEETSENQEHQWTITNPNAYPVAYTWKLGGAKREGTAIAPPGVSILDTGTYQRHVEHIRLFANGISVQPQSDDDVTPGQVAGALTGRVTDTGGNGVSSAQIVITNGANMVVAVGMSAPDGSYLIQDLNPGQYAVGFSATNYQPASVSAVLINSNATTTLNESLVPVPTTGTIFGYLRDSIGNALSGVSVTITDSTNAIQYQGTYSGSYSAPNLPVSTYSVSFSAPGYLTQTVPNVFLSAGASIEVDSALQLIPDGTIAGLVSTPAVKGVTPLAGVSVSVADLSNNPIGSTTTAADGSFSVSNVPQGMYVVTFTLSGYQTVTQAASVTAGSTTDLKVSMTHNADAIVTVNVQGPAGNVAGAAVTITNGDGSTASGVTDSNGNATFANQPVLPYPTSASATVTNQSTGDTLASGTTPVKSGWQSGQNNVTVVFRPGTGNFTGTATDGQGHNLSGVQVVATDSNNVQQGTTVTDVNGNYTLSNLPYGVYSVSGTLYGYNQGLLSNIELPNGTVQTENLTLTPNFGSLAGTVTDATTNQTIAGAVVQVFDSNNVMVANVATANDGTYLVPVLAQGTYTAAFSANNYNSLTDTGVAISVGTTTTHNAALQPLIATVFVTGIDSQTGNPIPNTTISIAYGNGTTVQGGAGASGTTAFNIQPVGVPATVTVTAQDGTSNTYSTGGWVSGNNNVAVQLNPASAQVQVHAVDTLGNPVSGASAVVNFVGGATAGPVNTDANGNATISTRVWGLGGTLVVSSGSQTQTASVSQLAPGQVFPATVTFQAPPASVTVVVNDGATGVGIPGCSVTVTYAGNGTVATGTTDASGSVQFTNQPTGVAPTVSAQAPDGTTATSNPSSWTSGSNIVTLTMTPASSQVNVVVKDPLGPVMNSGVILNFQFGNPSPPVFTDSNGMATISTRTWGLSATVTAYAPNISSPTVSSSVGALSPGQVQTVTLTFNQDVSATLTVNVRNASGPVANATVYVSYNNGTQSAAVTTNASGVAKLVGQQLDAAGTIHASNGAQSGSFSFTNLNAGFNPPITITVS